MTDDEVFASGEAWAEAWSILPIPVNVLKRRVEGL